jgi:hypothetical protein
MIAMPAVAQGGDAGVNYSRADYGAGDTDTYGINGGVAIPTSGNMVVLLDGAWNHNDDADVDVVSGSAHLDIRNDDMAWGGFVGLAHVDAGSGGDADAWGLGGEFAKFFGNSTLVLTAGWATDDDNNVDVTAGTVEYRIFATDNLRFDIGGGLANIDAGGPGDDDGNFIGAAVEYRFDNSPFSIGANVQHVDLGAGGDADVVGATFRIDFGHSSLKDRDRSGNTFGSFGGLSNFIG